MGNIGKTLQQGLLELRGLELSSVEFVRDYVQFRFGGPYLTVHNLPSVVTSPENTLISGGRCYRDSLCERIGIKVRGIKVVDDAEVAIDFEDGTTFKLSLEKKCGPEAIEFINEGGDIWVA